MGTPYEVLDPRPMAASAPYTYFLPDAESIKAICAGDLVKAVFRGVPPSDIYDSERLWIEITSLQNDWLEGILESRPVDIPNLPKGSVVQLPRSHVIDVIFADPDREPENQAQREYWERCLVDQCVIDGELRVGYLYRENRT